MNHSTFQPTATSEETHSAIVEVSNLCIRFEKQSVLENLNLRIRRGETVAVIGESGCGKTVFLKTLIGLIPPSSGTVHFDSQDLQTLRLSELAQLRTRIGFVFQSSALFDSLTVAENIAFPLRQAISAGPGESLISDHDLHALVVQSLRDVGLPSHVFQRYPNELSGGMQKRVGLARATILKPDLILYDEPTTGLDPIASDIINELILSSRLQHPVTSIVVTHDMKTARKVADRVIMFQPRSRLQTDENQVIYDGPPSDLNHQSDQRIQQFIHGEAGNRVLEMSGG
ncbi:MAG: ATP-binding cassette domain-containing protein [Planctomycetota bacterium]|nr:ATP-binding cassette domain-containing protein [Planctomycetota bacterium]